MMRHFLSEGADLLRERPVVSAGLTVALAVALCLGGLTASLALWIQPLLASGVKATPVAVLLRPQVKDTALKNWLASTTKSHSDWTFRIVPEKELTRRLAERFPYLKGLLEEEGPDLLPPLLEVTAPEPGAVRSLENSPAVLAVGPVATLHATLAATARKVEGLLGAVTVALLAIAFLMASIWVHLELYRHSDEIAIMRLVGATETSIRGPYLVSATVPGLVAGVLAVVTGNLGAGRLSRLATAVGLPPVTAPTWLLAGLFLFGVAVPLAAAAFTLSRHAHMGAEEL